MTCFPELPQVWELADLNSRVLAEWWGRGTVATTSHVLEKVRFSWSCSRASQADVEELKGWFARSFENVWPKLGDMLNVADPLVIMLHVWNIYQHLPQNNHPNVGKYTSIHGAYGLYHVIRYASQLLQKRRASIGFAKPCWEPQLAGRLTRNGLKPLAAPLLSHAKFATLWATALHTSCHWFLMISYDFYTFWILEQVRIIWRHAECLPKWAST